MSSRDPHGPRVTVLVPALDEEASLPGLLAAMPESVTDVLVVDNGSTDGTAEVATRAGAEVVVEPVRGYGAACLAGLRALRARPARPDILVFLDADHADGPARIPSLVHPIVQGRADFVLGVRRSEAVGTGALLPHARMGNRVILTLARLLFGDIGRDLGPFRALRFDRLEGLAMDDRDWGWTLQMQIRARRQRLRVEEIEIPHVRRRVGRSKISGSWTTSVRVGAKMFYTLGRERLRR